jgi:hypothetical protein
MRFTSLLQNCSVLILLGVATGLGAAKGRFEVITGKSLRKAVPRDFYLEGSAIPVDKENAVLIETPAGNRALFALIITAGFASRIQGKYYGMLISEGDLSICGKPIRIGSYGFGVRRLRVSRGHAQFFLYDQAGHQILACRMSRDLHMPEPRPLKIVIESTHSARLYLGGDWLELGP